MKRTSPNFWFGALNHPACWHLASTPAGDLSSSHWHWFTTQLVLFDILSWLSSACLACWSPWVTALALMAYPTPLLRLILSTGHHSPEVFRAEPHPAGHGDVEESRGEIHILLTGYWSPSLFLSSSDLSLVTSHSMDVWDLSFPSQVSPPTRVIFHSHPVYPAWLLPTLHANGLHLFSTPGIYIHLEPLRAAPWPQPLLPAFLPCHSSSSPVYPPTAFSLEFIYSDTQSFHSPPRTPKLLTNPSSSALTPKLLRVIARKHTYAVWCHLQNDHLISNPR